MVSSLRKVKWISDFQGTYWGFELRMSLTEKAVPILIYSNSIAKPLIHHIGISPAISKMATNIINKCKTANHLKSNCMGIQLQEKVGQGNRHISDFICVLMTRPTGDSEEIVLFLLKILTGRKIYLKS